MDHSSLDLAASPLPPVDGAVALAAVPARATLLLALHGAARDHAVSFDTSLAVVRQAARLGQVRSMHGNDGLPMVFDRVDSDWETSTNTRDPWPVRYCRRDWEKQTHATVDPAELAAVVGAIWPARQRPGSIPEALLCDRAGWHQPRDVAWALQHMPAVREAKISVTAAVHVLVAEVLLGRLPLAQRIDDTLASLRVAPTETLCGVVDGNPADLPAGHMIKLFTDDPEAARLATVRWEDHGRLGLRPKTARVHHDVLVHAESAMQAVEDVLAGRRRIGPAHGGSAWAKLAGFLEHRQAIAREAQMHGRVA